jgi:hypothetical protein
MATTPQPETSLTEQIENKIEAQASAAVKTLEQDAIEFIQAAVKHAQDAIPLLTGELGDGLNSLLSKAEDLAKKHGFKL